MSITDWWLTRTSKGSRMHTGTNDSPADAGAIPATITERLERLGVEIPMKAAAPAGVYVPAVVSGTYVYTAGQLPFVDGEIPATGKVGAEITAEAARGYARTSAINALAA